MKVFDGLFGVFADSLPDGWGLLMMSRAMRRAGMDAKRASALDRLSFIGRRAMGALVYEPAFEPGEDMGEALDLARLAAEVNRVLAGKARDVLSDDWGKGLLFTLGRGVIVGAGLYILVGDAVGCGLGDCSDKDESTMNTVLGISAVGCPPVQFEDSDSLFFA